MIGELFIERTMEIVGGAIVLFLLLVITVVVLKYAFRYSWRFAMWAIGDEIRWVQGGFRAVGRSVSAPFRHRAEKKGISALEAKVEDAEEVESLRRQMVQLEQRLNNMKPKDKAE